MLGGGTFPRRRNPELPSNRLCCSPESFARKSHTLASEQPTAISAPPQATATAVTKGSGDTGSRAATRP
eukprot:scaffold9903_cov30-Tisochrysis_lutea.AAC.12